MFLPPAQGMSTFYQVKTWRLGFNTQPLQRVLHDRDYSIQYDFVGFPLAEVMTPPLVSGLFSLPLSGRTNLLWTADALRPKFRGDFYCRRAKQLSETVQLAVNSRVQAEDPSRHRVGNFDATQSAKFHLVTDNLFRGERNRVG